MTKREQAAAAALNLATVQEWCRHYRDATEAISKQYGPCELVEVPVLVGQASVALRIRRTQLAESMANAALARMKGAEQ